MKRFLMPFAAASLLQAGAAARPFVDTMSDTWVATDGLGRSLPTAAETGPVKGDRTVAIFFFLWHCNYYKDPAQQGPFDIAKMLEKDPDLLKHPDSPLFGPFGRFHHWGEPLLGYYVGTDKAVYRKHAEWLSDAGVDAVFFDTTNGPIYLENVLTLLEAFAEHEAAGGKAPKIAFMCPFAREPTRRPSNLRATSLKRLWEHIYKPGVHPELWFRWDGKPLVLSYPSYCEGEPLVLLDAIGDVVKDEKIRKPARIEKGHRVGQSFEVKAPFSRVAASTPTHRSPTLCGVKLTLRKDGPEGPVLGERVADAVLDNDMTEIDLKKPIPAGRYYLELSDPVGKVSWWSRPDGEHKGAYQDGKPVGGFRHLRVMAYNPEAEQMKAFFTFRAPTSGVGYHHRTKGWDGAWAWAEVYPQDLRTGPDGKGEMVSVSVALNATATRAPVPMNSIDGVIGRTYHDGARDTDPAALAKGPCFQEQWKRALELDPPLVFVTGWNEWIMTRIRNWHGWEIPAGNFVDQYSPEFSRDIEPVRGYWGDAYYWQLVANVRRYKGVREVPPVTSAPIAVDGSFDDWGAVGPEFRDNAGDPTNRDHEGWGAAGRYVDKSGRNDIVVAKTSLSGGTLSFYVKVDGRLSAPADDWMRLFIDADRNAATGWLGYDFVIERDGGRTVLRTCASKTGEFKWSNVLAEATTAIGDCEMELSLPVSAFGGRLSADGFDFKWEDHCLQANDWTDFALHGDAAPNGRFNYRAIFRKPALAAADPYDYKELTTTESTPVELRPGLFDFGKDGVGWLEFHGVPTGEYELVMGEITNAAGHVAKVYPGSTIRCQRLKGAIDSDIYRVPMPPDKWNLAGYDPKAPAIRLPDWAGIVFPFRFVEVVKAPGKVSVSNLVRKMVHYPIDMKQSSFVCDNAVLNDLYEMFKYSMLATSFCGVYVDGDRERTPYEADAYINQLGQYAIDADCSLARKSHEWLMDHPTWPTEWKQHSIKIAWADWMWTGDTRSLAKCYDRLQKKLLGNYARRDIVDWPIVERDGFVMTNSNSVVDAFHCRNLVEMADIAAALGKTADAAGYRKAADEAKERFVKDYFDAATGLFVDSREVRHSSLHANAAALAFGLAPHGSVDGIVSFLEKKGLACSVYFAQYLLEAFCEADRADIAIRLMASTGERSWKAMLDFGSTISMEAWNMKAKPNQDLNHAWGAAPLNIIARYVLGVTPLEPGFAKILVRPRVGELQDVKGVVPTVKGPVTVEVRKGRLTVDVPAPTRVVWFGRTHDVPAGHHEF